MFTGCLGQQMKGISSMRFLSVLPLITPVLLLASCISDPYNVPDPGPVTALEEPEDRRYTVTYRGNSFSSAERVRDLALLRAATITLQKGGTWFEVVTDYSRIEDTQPTQFEQDPFRESGALQNNCGVLGCPSDARPDDILGQRDRDAEDRNRTNVIQSFEIIVNSGERPFTKENSYDALEVSDEMRRRYSNAEK